MIACGEFRVMIGFAKLWCASGTAWSRVMIAFGEFRVMIGFAKLWCASGTAWVSERSWRIYQKKDRESDFSVLFLFCKWDDKVAPFALKPCDFSFSNITIIKKVIFKFWFVELCLTSSASSPTASRSPLPCLGEGFGKMQTVAYFVSVKGFSWVSSGVRYR